MSTLKERTGAAVIDAYRTLDEEARRLERGRAEVRIVTNAIELRVTSPIRVGAGRPRDDRLNVELAWTATRLVELGDLAHRPELLEQAVAGIVTAIDAAVAARVAG